jgi:outer membrane protein OmpA-like peptidoglycan-associated protein
MTRVSARITRAIAWVVPVALAAGCVSAEQQAAAQAQLKRAQAAYAQASADPSVQASAQLPLLDAQKTLQVAERATDVKDIQQLGYLAEKKSQTAEEIGLIRRTEQEAQALTKETSDMQLQKREAEAKAARAELDKARQVNEARARQLEVQAQEIDKAKRETDQARMAADARAREVEAKSREAEQARMQTEAKSRETEQARMQMAAAQAQTAALTKELSELKATQTDRGVVLTVGSALFATGKADVAPGIQRSADKLVAFLQSNPKRNVLIEGHTDNTGSNEGNVKLSQERADAIKTLLVSKGIAPERIVAKGYGSQYPQVDNATPAGRQANRRVEIVVLHEGVSPQSITR